MQELNQAPREKLAALKGIFTDIDETLSTRGKLTASAYQALWDLREAGLKVVPVTGRAAGWCDHIGRFWPVDAVVGENGGFYFYDDGKKLHRRFLYSEAQRQAFRKKLEILRQEILGEVPGCAVASDQLYREYDLAVDFCEDVPPLGEKAIQKIKALFERQGATAKISSIHVNGWFGDFDKLSMAKICARERWNIDLETEPEAFCFCGDSPNDAPMFDFFPLSFGMANVRPFLDRIDTPPKYITPSESGAGFVETARRILEAKGL